MCSRAGIGAKSRIFIPPSVLGLGGSQQGTPKHPLFNGSMTSFGKFDQIFRARRRGYGKSAAQVLQALQEGADPGDTGERFRPGGSYGNGGAMRIAPLGLAYRCPLS